MKVSRLSSPHRNGFSLVEILVVVAIIGVLAALLFPAVRGVLEANNRSSAMANLRNLQRINEQYAVDSGGRYFPLQATGGSWWYQLDGFNEYSGFTGPVNQRGRQKLLTRPGLKIPANRTWPDFSANREQLVENTTSTGQPRMSEGHIKMQIVEPSKKMAFCEGTFILVRRSQRESYDGTENRVGGSFAPAYRNPMPKTPDNPQGQGALVAFFDGHVELVSRGFMSTNTFIWEPYTSR
jgi:prepilin-type N-terminal cleavage/methylation domain-containing protein/prepilin-type processing-associated H-X9-DG protein